MHKLLYIVDGLIVDASIVEDPESVSLNDSLALVDYDSDIGIGWEFNGTEFVDNRPIPVMDY